jgi:hypothetical protein
LLFTVHGVDQQDRPVLRINLRRPQLASFFKRLLPTEIAMEACGSSHHWAREPRRIGAALAPVTKELKFPISETTSTAEPNSDPTKRLWTIQKGVDARKANFISPGTFCNRPRLAMLHPANANMEARLCQLKMARAVENAMCSDLIDRSYPGDIFFVYGAHTTQDFIFREELEYLQKDAWA